MSAEISLSIKNYQRTLERLQEALAISESSIKVDAVIQRFEFTYELAWKTLKRCLLSEGEICKTPRDCLKAAFRIGWIDSEENWLQMLDDRNLMAHVYQEATARKIYRRIFNYVDLLSDLHRQLKARYQESDKPG